MFTIAKSSAAPWTIFLLLYGTSLQETLMTTLLASQAQAASQASVFSSELGSAKSELESYLRAIEDDRR